jgi:hypothetical protein
MISVTPSYWADLEQDSGADETERGSHERTRLLDQAAAQVVPGREQDRDMAAVQIP